MYSAVPYVSVVVFMTIYYSTLYTMSNVFCCLFMMDTSGHVEEYHRIDA